MAGSSSSTTTLITNGKIFLSGVEPGTNPLPNQPPTFAESLLIRDSTIAFVGASDSPAVKDALALAAAGTEVVVVDLAGKTVLPGFIDGHMHLMLLGQSLQKLDLGHCKDLADIQATISAHAAANPHLPRILCRGWMHSMTPGGVTARDLDGVDPLGRAVLVDTKDLHSTWANTAAVAALGADAWPDVVGGVIQRDADGRADGVFSEAANITYVWPYLTATASLADRAAAVRAAVRAYHAEGYTGMIDMAMDEGGWEALLHAATAEESPLPMRVAAYWLIKPMETDAETLVQVDRAAELAAQYNARTSPDCRIVGIKVICDGIIDACTAGLTEPYLSGVGAANDSPDLLHPAPLWPADRLAPVVRRATELGLQIALHAIGDATIGMVADTLGAHASPARRPRMEHIELPSRHDAARLGALGITASVQPVHADPAILRAWPRLLGESRCARAFPYREFADGGAPLALGSDSPTAPHAPLGNVYVGTTRRSYREPALGTAVNAHFALGLCEAVAAATEGAAYSCFDERRTGRLDEGLKADFVVVDMQWEKTRLLEARIEQTWFDGKKVWDCEG